MTEPLPAPIQDSEFVASMAIYKNADGTFKALLQYGDEHPDWVEVPPHLAVQLPMAMSMLRSM